MNLEYEINRVEPYKPILDDFIICGKSLCAQERPPETILQDIDEAPQKIEQTPKAQPIFSINGYNVYENDSGRKEIRMSYDCDFTTKKVCTKYVNLINKGKIAIRVTWKRFKHPNLFADIIKEKFEESIFAFNKNLVVIIPGDNYQYPVHFKPFKTGRFEENWQLIFSPSIGVNLEIIIQLVAISYNPGIHDKCNEIEKMFEIKLKRSIIDTAINTAIDRAAEFQRPMIYTYNKMELFEATNSNFDPVQRTNQYIYDNDVVDELTKFYQKVRLPHHPKIWNLNIETLQYVTEEREAFEKAKMYKEHFLDVNPNEKPVHANVIDVELTTTCGMDFEEEDETDEVNGSKGKEKKIKGKKEKQSKSSKSKIGSAKTEIEKVPIVPDIESDVAEEEEMDEETREKIMPMNKFRLELTEILKKLTKTINFRNNEQRKYAFAHSIFVRGMNQLCKWLHYFHRKYAINPPSNYPHVPTSPIVKNSKRQTFEYFDDVFKPQEVFLIPFNLRDRPPPDILKDIPIEDCDRRYRAYFNITEEPETPIKNVKGKKDKKGKNKKEKGNDKKEKGNDKKGKSKDKKVKEKDNKGKESGKKKEKGAKNEKKEKDKDDEKKNEAEESEICDIDLNFDPYKEIYLDPVSTLDDLPIEVAKGHISSSLKVVINYRYNLFVLFYTMLNNIIMEIIELFENVGTTKLPPSDIKKVESCYNLVVDHKSNSYTKFINLDVIIALLSNNEDVNEVKEKLITNVNQYICPQIQIRKPELNPYIKPNSSISSVSKCLRRLERRKEKITQKKTFSHKRRYVPPTDRMNRYMLSYEPEPLPFSKEVEVQVTEDVYETIDKAKSELVSGVAEKVDGFIEQPESSLKDLTKQMISCAIWKCSQYSLAEEAHMTKHIDTKMNLIEQVLTEIKRYSLNNAENMQPEVNEELVSEVCEVMAQRGLLDFADGDEEEYVDIEKQDDVFYDSNDDIGD